LLQLSLRLISDSGALPIRHYQFVIDPSGR
jgi:hypothetical protein